MLMLIFKIISIAILMGIAVVMFVDSYKNYKQGYDSLANCFLIPLFILFVATLLTMLYVII